MNHFQRVIYDHYGTMKRFYRDMKINHITAAGYLRDPDKMQMRFIRKLSERTGISVVEIIGEKIVGEGEE